MLKKTRAFLGSYSFRAGLLIFLTLSAILTTQRVQFYRESIDTAYANIRAIIEAHEADINQEIRENSASDSLAIVNSILSDNHDRHLYLELKEANRKAGNFPEWKFGKRLRPGWSQITIPASDEVPERQVLLKFSRYSDRISLLVGYDLESIVDLRETLFGILVSNVILAFAAALVLSAISVWLINIKLRQVNRTAEAVIQGNLSKRVPVRQMSDQFDRLGENINRMLDWISKLLDTARYASNALAHDMRTPLSRHRIELRTLAKQEDVPEHIRDDILRAVERVDNLAGMFSTITNIARAESGAGAELFSVFDIAGAARDVVDLYAYEFEQNSQNLVVNIPGHPIEILGDKQLVSQAIANLLDNASKYAPVGATVHFSLTLEGAAGSRSIIITVADNGPGIPAELNEKVTQRFFRLEQSRHTEGTGLGLSLVNAVASLHHGRLILEDNQPGLKAQLSLPVQHL